MPPLSHQLEVLHDVLHTQSANLSLKYSLGPASVACALTDGRGAIEPVFERAYGGWPSEGADAAVGLRSLSKMLVAAALMALIERPGSIVRLNSTLGSLVPACAGSLLAAATPSQLLSMSSPLDNRLNAAWRASARMDDHSGFPPYCDHAQLSPLECAETVVCPAYPVPSAQPAEAEAGFDASILPHEVETVSRVCADDWRGGSPDASKAPGLFNVQCQQWKRGGYCMINPGV